MTDRITFVIFDMDGVLYDKLAGVRLRALAALSGRDEEEIDQAIFQSGFEEAAEAGHPATGADYLAGFAERLGAPIDRKTWVTIRKQMMQPKLRVFALARRVAQCADISMLTNNSILLKEALSDCAPEAIALFGAAAHVSAEFGARKPDAAVYRKLCARHGHAPEHSLMIDDARKNVDGAVRAGLKGCLFTNPIALEVELARLGLCGRAAVAAGRPGGLPVRNRQRRIARQS